ncbi:glycerophosphodiester phosphodiesterase [Larkinella rosea]|uniref:Glycerophosphodiester phosphodiesterase n=1 Tax=Larkinella rosea TaxID=2025312 RepID=A0A3P1C146_9BACT|nr:glycerophosphodiester phosphodiesterase family protein [Larkinella rosea]RRB07140.1 glycerophosphodiester phosphodiesterase [Larkinella rosea]
MKNRIGVFSVILFIVASSCQKDPGSSPTYQTQVVAHRGAWKSAGVPENSIASLQQAIRLGCYASETDVQMASDSVLYLFHDTAVQGITLESAPGSQLSALKLSNGEALPTLQAYLAEALKQSRTRVILEIKGSRISKNRSLATARKTIELVKSLNARHLVDYCSFDYDVCKYMLVLDPAAKVAYLNGDQPPEQLALDKLSGMDYYFGNLVLKPSWIEEARQKKLTVGVWTVNDQMSMKWFLDQHVDFITTDEPELLLNLLK